MKQAPLAPLTIIAHRGASALAPENTMAAFSEALDLGVDVIETDIRATRDGQLVLCHDDSLARLTGRPDKIADLDQAALREIIVGLDPTHGVQRIPTLNDLLRFVAGRARVLLDLKLTPDHDTRLLAAIRAANAEDAVILGVRSVISLYTFKELAPQITTLAFGRTIGDVWAMAEAGADIVRLWSPWLDDQALDQASQRNKPVWVMCGAPTVGGVGEATLPELLDYRRRGVVGVILNDPRLAALANAREASAAVS